MASVPVIHQNEPKARQAYLAYLGMLAHEKADPTLAKNSTWAAAKAVCLRAYDRAHEVSA